MRRSIKWLLIEKKYLLTDPPLCSICHVTIAARQLHLSYGRLRDCSLRLVIADIRNCSEARYLRLLSCYRNTPDSPLFWDSGYSELSLGLEKSLSQVSRVCVFCSSYRNFAHQELFISQSGFLQIPLLDGHPCLRLMLPTTKCRVAFHYQVIAHAERIKK